MNGKVNQKNIINTWPELPNNINAAFRSRHGKQYFFQGDRYWKYFDNNTIVRGYPKTITKHFKGIPDNIDAVLHMPNTRLQTILYFFKG